MPIKPATITDASRLAEDWRGQQEDYERALTLTARFSETAPTDVVRMWGTGRNEKGRPLTKSEVEALAERWHRIFGTEPPFAGTTQIGTTAAEPEPDGPLLTMRDVTRMTTMSKTTIKRWINDKDNDFPRPVKLSPRRVGWRKEDVAAWIERRR